MLPKPIYNSARNYVRQLKRELEAETVGKTGISAVPVEVGHQIERHLESLGVRRCDMAMTLISFCDRMAKENLITRHPLGGWMVTQVKDAPPCPGREEVKTGLTRTINKIAQQEAINQEFVSLGKSMDAMMEGRD